MQESVMWRRRIRENERECLCFLHDIKTRTLYMNGNCIIRYTKQPMGYSSCKNNLFVYNFGKLVLF